MLAPNHAVNQSSVVKLFEHTKRQGHFALLLHPKSCPRGFALFFAHILPNTDHDLPTRTLNTVEMSTMGLRDSLICDLKSRVRPLGEIHNWIVEEAKHFNNAVAGSQAFMGGLHLPQLFADKEKVISKDDLPDFGKYAVARAYERLVPCMDTKKADREFPFQSRLALQDVLYRVMVPGTL